MNGEKSTNELNSGACSVSSHDRWEPNYRKIDMMEVVNRFREGGVGGQEEEESYTIGQEDQEKSLHEHVMVLLDLAMAIVDDDPNKMSVSGQ
mmetsp:Transcript_37756/g.53261  ORF Transcript_37756/g.53261 Transcript_37756/m.53261 type:complete len:92 (-) Transcript_37756:258-533(-)|eukprot:CAMPEP_0202457940 /NCGR_PEP_ID=MMETSP1360-20130828/18157_1 /ASSEMBLY_ACC=CAM_ASM_000848 /TAXON_ID=515479 /ORGANISM="Licmophora paradoxa, Strain CCMP2313" /LENGTH=91 /DNA_ID=CAMNT_0049078183 /DNA_START=52 /DNA_END=327 /DNA_ORIENTATION=+